MGALKYVNAVPKDVRYYGAAVNVVKFDGVVVWQRLETYGITCTITGQGYETITDCNCSGGGNCNCGQSDNCDCSRDCNCESTTNRYDYTLAMTFTGVRKFPIKYVSKSGAAVTIEQSAVKGSGTTYTYSRTIGTSDASFSNANALEAVKSVYPASGISGYSQIGSITVSYKNNGVSVDDQRTGCTNCDSQCENRDCDCYEAGC